MRSKKPLMKITMKMEASTKLISAIKRFEGLLCKTYLDCAGVAAYAQLHQKNENEEDKN